MKNPRTFEECKIALKKCPRKNVKLKKKLMKLKGQLPKQADLDRMAAEAAAALGEFQVSVSLC